jgi:hypothetical protein
MLDEREHLPDDLADYVRRLEELEAGTARPTTEEQEARAPGPQYFVDMHVYPLASGEPATPPSIEGRLAEVSPDHQDAPEGGSQNEQDTAPLAPSTARRKGRLHLTTWICLTVWTLVALAIGVWYGLVPLFMPTATVTIVPVSKAITATGSLTVVTGPANAAQHEIPGRLLSTITMSQAERIPTTGVGHQDAQAAHGTITFSNAAPSVQMVSAGTLLVGADGVQVVTDSEAVIPAGNLTTGRYGQVTVSAHAVLAGPAGNIAAHDIYGQCCRLNVFAANSAFTGGQDARTYPEVTAHDISTVASSLEKSLTRSMQAAFQPQVRSDETLITPLPCTPLVSPDHQAGTEATEVQVTVSLICTGEVYRTSAYEAKVAQLVTHAALPLGAGYAPTSTIQVSVTAVTYRPHGAVSLVVKAAGTWTYQVDQAERTEMLQRIAGKSKAQATSLLLAMPGVQSAAIEEERGDQLPADPSRIQVMIVAD